MNARALGVGALAAFVLSLSTVFATEKPAPDRPDPMLTLGGLTTEDYSEGIGDAVLPLFFNGERAP